MPPSPQPPSRREGGRFLVYFAGGFAPGTPAFNRLRHVQPLPCRCPAGVCLLCRLLPPAFIFFPAPIPRPPSPPGKGEPKVISCKGLRPLHPRAEPSAAREKRGEPYARQGACLSCRPPPLTLVCFFAPIPPTPFPAGRGSPKLFHARGSAPCIPGAEPTVRRQSDRKQFPMSSAGSQGEGGPGEMELSVASDGGV